MLEPSGERRKGRYVWHGLLLSSHRHAGCHGSQSRPWLCLMPLRWLTSSQTLPWWSEWGDESHCAGNLSRSWCSGSLCWRRSKAAGWMKEIWRPVPPTGRADSPTHGWCGSLFSPLPCGFQSMLQVLAFAARSGLHMFGETTGGFNRT